MTNTESALPTHNGPVALARGFLAGGVAGVTLAALVVAAVIESVPVLLMGLGLPLVHGVLVFVAGMPRRARRAAVVPHTALAMIESRRALGGESGETAMEFALTVAPDDEPAYRVKTTQYINLVDVPDYRPRAVLVVEYPPDRPWRVRIVGKPTPQWERRAAESRLDSAPDSSLVERPPRGCAFGAVVPIGLLLGAAAVLLMFRADLLAADDPTRPHNSAKPSVSSSSSTTLTSSGLSTVTVGPNQSMLDKGALRRSVDSLTKGKKSRPALSVVVQEHMVSVVFTPTDIQAPQFDARSLPYERIPALVEEAKNTLGVGSPQTWQLTADHFAGALTIRITVNGPDGGASLDANGKGKVIRRSPAR